MYQFAAEPLLPWSDTDNDQRFNKIAKKVFIIFLVLFLVIPFLPTPEVKKDTFVDVPPRVARLLIKQPIKPIIKKVETKKIEKKKKVEKKKPKKKPKKKVVKKKKVKPKPSAEKIARSAFADAGFGDALNDLTDDFDVAALKQSKLKVNKKSKVKFDTFNVLTSSAASAGSGGIKNSTVNVGKSTKLAQRTTTNVRSTISTTTNKTKRKRSVGRSDEEIQIVFQTNQSAIYSLYNRALRKDPGLKGIILLKITINEAGKAIQIKIISSELNNKALEKRIRLRIKRFKFGAKPGTGNFTFTYPLDLIPS